MSKILKRIGFAVWAILLLFLMTGLMTPEWKFALQLIAIYLTWSIFAKFIAGRIFRKNEDFDCEKKEEYEEDNFIEVKEEKKTCNAEKSVNQEPQLKTRTVTKKKEMSAYELERFAAECNAYVVREERSKNN